MSNNCNDCLYIRHDVFTEPCKSCIKDNTPENISKKHQKEKVKKTCNDCKYRYEDSANYPCNRCHENDEFVAQEKPIPYNTTFCEHCRVDVGYTIIDTGCNYPAKLAICDKCEQDVHVHSVEDYNVEHLQKSRLETPKTDELVEWCKPDEVNHPSHYNKGRIEVIDFIEDQQLDFCLGNVIKYVCRHDKKGGLEDLRKAMFYLDRKIKGLSR